MGLCMVAGINNIRYQTLSTLYNQYMKKLALLLTLLSLLSSCQKVGDGPDLLANIRQSKQLVVVTRNAPTTYYDWHDELTGFEYDMTQAFASSLNVEVKYIIKNSTAEILAALASGEAHLAAAGLTKTRERDQKFLFGPVYQQVQQQVVCRRGGPRPKNVADLVGVGLTVPAGTSYVERLVVLKQKHPQLSWETEDDSGTESLLERVWLKKLDCTVADSNITAINRRYYPELQVRFSIAKLEDLAWILPPQADDLAAELQHWFDEFKRTGKLQALFDRYYGFIEIFDFVDTRKFVRSIKNVLPKYRKYFEQAASDYGLDWTLLAAQSYQESHWRALAKSPTGVRGMMMLTRTTARELGIKSRLDPKQSINGGAKYLSKLFKRIPEAVPEQERLWFAMAAYNVGMGHLYDVRALARRLNKDPNRWSDVAEVFPLLTKRKYYKTVKHGYARGREPVRYVQRIRDYHNILLQRLNNH